jgi:chemotaxis protein histidine kinase CheA
VVSSTPVWVRELWSQVRPTVLEQSERLVAEATVWADSPDQLTWRRMLAESHKLAGSIGSFGFETADEAAHALDALLHSFDPDPDRVVAAAVRLRAALETT